MRLLSIGMMLFASVALSAREELPDPPADDTHALEPTPVVGLPLELLSDPVDEPASAERLIDEQEAHIRRLRALQRRAELQAAERDLQKAFAETEQAKADAEKARMTARPPPPKIVYESPGSTTPVVPAPSLIGVTKQAAILDYAGAVHTVAVSQRLHGWLLREVGFDYAVLEGPGGAIRRQELGW